MFQQYNLSWFRFQGCSRTPCLGLVRSMRGNSKSKSFCTLGSSSFEYKHQAGRGLGPTPSTGCSAGLRCLRKTRCLFLARYEASHFWQQKRPCFKMYSVTCGRLFFLNPLCPRPEALTLNQPYISPKRQTEKLQTGSTLRPCIDSGIKPG